MKLDPQKIILNGNDYEFVPAEVVSVDYESLDPDRLYTIQCKFLNAASATSQADLIQARALNANIKHIPIIGEIVFVCKAPTPFHSGASFGREYYYTSPISIQSSINHNGLPGANKISATGKSKSQRINESRQGIPTKLSEDNPTGETIDPGFPERKDVFPIQPFPGDIIVEGRWGGSIRFGSTVDTRRKYPQPPSWGNGTGATGNPILILSNGTNPKANQKTYNAFHMESPDDDDAYIALTSGQSVKFTPASTYDPSIRDKQIDLFRKNLFAGNQILAASDRIVLNARKQELIMFAKNGIGLSTDKTIALNGKNLVEAESERINAGFNATSPMVLGDRMIEAMATLTNLIIEMNKALLILTVPTGTGPSGTPLNSGDFVSIINGLSNLMRVLPKTASQFAFVNEKSGGPSDTDKEKFKELERNGFVVKLPENQMGDRSGRVSFDNLEP